MSNEQRSPQPVQQRWTFKCSQCGAFKVSDLIVHPDGRVQRVQLIDRQIKQTPGVENWIGVGGTLHRAPTSYQVLDHVETVLEAERRCVCGAVAEGSVITGRFSQRSVCDATCTWAVGDDCECQCGGQNHGVSWVGLGWRLVFTPNGSRKHARQDTTVEATPEAVAEILRRKAEAKAEREAATRRDAESALDAERRRWTAEHAEVAQYLADHYMDSDFLGSLQGALDRWGHLTERQVLAVEWNIERDRHRAREREATAQAAPAPAGKATVEGVVLHVKERPGFRDRDEFHMTVRLDDGNRVWASVPYDLYRQFAGPNLSHHRDWTAIAEGRRVRFTATFTRSDRDEHFSFGKQPRNAELLPEPIGDTAR